MHGKCRLAVYTRFMRRTKFAIGATAWLSLLMLQLTGLHAHANEHGYIGVPETANSHTHSHASDHDGDHHRHDYEDARDVSLFEIASGAFKSPLAIPALILLFSFFPRTRTFARANLAYPVLSGRHTRWRPPLRAPPSLAQFQLLFV
jgi:hypothetical protein